MKNTRICIKCNSEKVVRISNAEWSGGNKIIISSMRRVPVTRFLCTECGYSEEWVESEKNLELIKEKF